ncbi:COX15/CtaA family protein [Poriferisphaera corsica]|nr:COX15/CtaA family protein [Poriferisphaera corsica]
MKNQKNDQPPRADDQLTTHPSANYSLLTHITAILLFLITFILITVGGNVTSLDQGLAVPDGWTTFGHWTLIAPPSVWWENMGTFWEHSHRLFGNAAGILSIALVLLAYIKQRDRIWLPNTALLLLLMIVVQGIMGVYRVTELSTALALIHGVFGQVILATCVLLVAATSKLWINYTKSWKPNQQLTLKTLRIMSLLMVFFLLIQLILGAGVRHSKSALAIPDFPKMHGEWIPPLTQAAVDAKFDEYKAQKVFTREYTVSQVHLHLTHRLLAFFILFFGLIYFIMMLKQSRISPILLGPAFTVINLLFLQVILGILVIWSNDYPINATVHQACGAALLAACVWAAIRIHLAAAGTYLPQTTSTTSSPQKPSAQGGLA